MFIDEVILELIAGSGGNGCMAFRHEKYIEMGGPYGGNGGRGGNIVFIVDEGLNTLIDLRYKKKIIGNKGENGLGKGMNGKSAIDTIIKVPLGTVITDFDNGMIIADLVNKDDEVIIAHGGRGGRGNMAFATHNNPAPHFAENGEPGEEIKVKIELKLLADVGLVGLPSVGKSTLISKISAAKPKIAAYHFTTLTPNLGVVKGHKSSFVVADMPGLIEGASLGEGLGTQFLKHIERTRIIAHVIDMSGIEGRKPYDDYVIIRKELESFGHNLGNKPEVIVANKMDMDSSINNLKEFKNKVDIPVIEISAITGNGLDKLVNTLENMLDDIKKEPLYNEEKLESHILYKYEKEELFKIIRENNTWVIKGKAPEKLLKMTKFSGDDAARRFTNKLKKMGIDDKLKELGAVDGDTVRILDYEFEFKI